MMKSTNFNVTHLTFAIVGMFTLHEPWTANSAVSVIPYSEFQQAIRESKAKAVAIATDTVQADLKAEHNGRSGFVTTPANG